MQVEATFTELGAGAARAAHEPLVAGPLLAARLREERLRRARVRRRRPGAGRRRGPIRTAGPSPAHGGSVTVRYKVFGDRVDGTYLAHRLDARAHQHAGGDHVGARARRPARDCSRSSRPPGARWQVATQLHPGATPFEFTAPNLQYLMDSPAEFGPVVDPSVHASTAARSASRCITPAPTPSSTRSSRDVEKIVREQGDDLRRVPGLRAGHLHLPRRLPAVGHGDGMEHRNSTVITSARVARAATASGCSTRSRTSSSTAGTSSASGRGRSSRSTSSGRTCPASCGSPKGSRSTTARSTLSRAGLVGSSRDRRDARRPGRSVALNPGAHCAQRRGDEPDGAVHRRRPDRRSDQLVDTSSPTIPFGGAIALALDLSLRGRSDGRVTLDDFMRAMWRVHGKPGGSAPGLRRSSVHDRRCRGAAGRGERRRGVRARLLRPLHPGPRGRRLRGAARAGGAGAAQAATRAARGGATRASSCRGGSVRLSEPPCSRRRCMSAGSTSATRSSRSATAGFRRRTTCPPRWDVSGPATPLQFSSSIAAAWSGRRA